MVSWLNGISILVGLFYIKVYLIIIYIYQPLCLGRIWHKVSFYVEFKRFEFRVFPSTRLVAFTKAEEPSLSYYLPIVGGK